MDWYLGDSIDDLVVPKVGELPDRLPSPDSWFKWGTSAPESIGSRNKCFVMDSDLPRDELNINGKRSSCYDVKMGASVNSMDHSSDSSVGGDISISHQQSALVSHGQPDYQLDDFPGIEQMDDIFLSSLLDDLPVIENFHKSVCISPGSQSDTKTSKSVSRHMDDSLSTSNDINRMESFKYARTDGLYASVGWENRKVAPCRSGLKDHPLVKAPQVEHFSPCEENSKNEYAGEEASLEESVLQDLEIVMTQLTEKTRICFRDALYRLAKNSEHHTVPTTTDIKEPVPWSAHDETIRPEGMKPIESETNIIDRAVANLMFSEMESNVHDIVVGVPANFKQEVDEASGCHSYLSSPPEKTFSRDAQLQICGHRAIRNMA